MSLLDRDIETRFERSRFANAVTYVDETDTGERRFEVEFEVVNDPGGAGVVLTYDLKRPTTSRHLVSVGSSRLTAWAIDVGTGPAESDQISFAVVDLPANGSIVRVAYVVDLNPFGEYFGRRTAIELDEESDPLTYRTTGDEKLWHIAGRQDTFNDPSWFWVLADTNEGLNGVFQAMLTPIPRDVDILIPNEAEVLLQIEGLFEL